MCEFAATLELHTRALGGIAEVTRAMDAMLFIMMVALIVAGARL
jgi:hypothetical protein